MVSDYVWALLSSWMRQLAEAGHPRAHQTTATLISGAPRGSLAGRRIPCVACIDLFAVGSFDHFSGKRAVSRNPEN